MRHEKECVLNMPSTFTRWKKWDDLKDSHKYKRKLRYKKILGNALSKLPDCNISKMELTVGSEELLFEWDTSQLSHIKSHTSIVQGTVCINVHCITTNVIYTLCNSI